MKRYPQMKALWHLRMATILVQYPSVMSILSILTMVRQLGPKLRMALRHLGQQLKSSFPLEIQTVMRPLRTTRSLMVVLKIATKFYTTFPSHLASPFPTTTCTVEEANFSHFTSISVKKTLDSFKFEPKLFISRLHLERIPSKLSQWTCLHLADVFVLLMVQFGN